MFGFHLSGSNIEKLLEEIDELGVNSVQIFIRVPRVKNGPLTKYGAGPVVKLKKYIKKGGIKLFTHGTYPLNLIMDRIDILSVKSLVKELRWLEIVGGVGCVFHLGSSKRYPGKASWEKFCKNIVRHLRIIRKYAPYGELLMENQATAGSKVMTRVDEMISLWKFVKGKVKGVGFCFDTCHDFVSSYKYAQKMNIKREKIGDNIRKLLSAGVPVGCVHLNDCKVADRDVHDNLMDGLIPPEELLDVIAICKKRKIPMIIERIKSSRLEKIKMIKIVSDV